MVLNRVPKWNVCSRTEVPQHSTVLGNVIIKIFDLRAVVAKFHANNWIQNTSEMNPPLEQSASTPSSVYYKRMMWMFIQI